MLAVEEILLELERNEMNEQGGLPPGFRFHPTDEELITFYLASKVFDGSFCGVEIAEVDLNRCEPWELPDVAKMGEKEWYFFSLRDRKYPTGLRTNRATSAGYWKATGKDREIYSNSSGALLGMKKTLVFYRGRAPRGEKTKWVMHEYRLDGDFSCRHTCKEEWVICRIFHKMGERKSPPMLQPQNYFTKIPSFPTITTPNSLPPLLEPQQKLLEPHFHQDSQLMQILNQNHQNPFLVHGQESDLKSLINPLVSQCDLSVDFTHPTSSFTNPSITPNKDSILFKPFPSNQDFTLKELSNAIGKECKKENTFSHHYQSSDCFVNMNWQGKIQENNTKYQNPLIFGLEGCGNEMGTIASITAARIEDTVNVNTSAMNASAIDHVMSTEPALKWW